MTMDFSNPTSVHEMIMENLYFQRKTGRYCDIRLTLGKESAWIHSAVLCAISPFINNECCNACPQANKYKTFSFNSPLTIRLQKKENSDCFKCLQKLMDIIYGQKITIEPLHSPHIHALCKIFNFSDVLVNIISNQLNKSTYQTNSKTELDNHNESNNSEERNADDKKNVISHMHMDLSYLKVLSGKMQSCISCQYKCYKPSDLLTHLRNTSHGEKVCSLCFAEADTTRELEDHYSLHDDPKPFFCTFCDVRFQTRTLLTQHLPRHSSETPYTCPHCSKGFKWKHGLNSHLVTHSNEKKHLCDECGFSTIHAKTLRAHKLTHTGELFKCSHPGCVHTSSRKENMKIHLETHNKQKPFVCEICGHKFTQSKSLKRHALIHRTGGSVHICPQCPFKSHRTDYLKAHVIKVHKGQPGFELCDEFTGSLMNIECTIASIEDDSEIFFEPSQASQPIVKDENDLAVLADAASSCKKIEGLSLISRDFDNLIPKPDDISADEIPYSIPRHLITLEYINGS